MLALSAILASTVRDLHPRDETISFNPNIHDHSTNQLLRYMVGSLASSGVLGPSIWVKFPLEPVDVTV